MFIKDGCYLYEIISGYVFPFFKTLYEGIYGLNSEYINIPKYVVLDDLYEAQLIEVKEYIEENGEDASSTSTFGFIWNNYGYNLSDELYVAQRNVICELADKGNCVIVGRCSDYILRDRKDVLNVFIHADFEYRKNRVVSVYGQNEFAPDKRIKDKDKRRIAYYKYYTDRKWADAKNYQLCLDSGVLGIDKCVELIEKAM